MPIITIKDLIAYRMRNDLLVRQDVIRGRYANTRFGEFKMTAFEERLTGDIHLAMHKGEWDRKRTGTGAGSFPVRNG